MTEHPAPPGWSRRAFLRAGGLAAGSVVLADLVLPGDTPLARAARAADDVPFTRPLRIPRVLTGDHITLVARQAQVQVLDGPKTLMWTFDGEFPGPTIRRPSGRRTTVTVQHRLPAAAGSLTIHHHGGHQASSEDGQPERNVIMPGGQRTYIYEHQEDGRPERGAMQWYHDHSHFRTSRNVWRGLAGMVILDDPAECDLALPCDAYDLPLMIGDRTFDEGNQLTDPFPVYDDSSPPGAGSGFPPNDDVFGLTYLVNGVPQPYLIVQPRRYRLRILNSAIFRIYNLALSDSSPLTQIGTESGLLPYPLRRSQVLLGPAERVDLVVDFAGKEGRTLELRSVSTTEGNPVPRTAPAVASLMQFRVQRKKVRDTSRVPAALRPLPDWAAGLAAEPDRVWVFGLGVDTAGKTAWTINGLAFDHTRVDARPELDSTETWMLVNASANAISHYIHLHDVDWVVLSRNGSPATGDEIGLKETFRLDPGEVLVIGSKFTDHLGPYMLHCHMLQHEDHGMMTTFEVVERGAGDLPTAPAALDAALARDIADPAVQRHARLVVDNAQAGRPAPAWVLAQCTVGARPVPATDHHL